MNKGPKNWVSPLVIEPMSSKFASLDIFSKLLKDDKTIFIGEEITEEMCNVVQAQLLYLSSQNDKDVITLYINSPGGSVYAGLGIWDTLRFIPNPIKTVNTGMCASMGAILLLAGDEDKRFALKHSRTMIHQPMGGVRGQQSDIEITANEIKILREELNEIIVENTNLTFDNINQYTDRDYWMTSPKALELGFINKIL